MKKTDGAKPKKHILRNILLVLLVLVLALVAFVFVNAQNNVRQMNAAADRTMAAVRSHCTVTPVDCSEFKDLKVYGFMQFETEQYDIEDLGNLCVMRANGGVMQMLTVMFTPARKDMPLMSVDYMYMLGNRTAYVEVYDLPVERTEAYEACIARLQAVAGEYTHLADTTPTPAWYDSIRPAGSYKSVKSKDDAAILDMLDSYLEVYLTDAAAAELLPEEQIPAKCDAMESYSHRLISEGGVSTDVFKKELGEERTTRLFDTVMFGTGNYR